MPGAFTTGGDCSDSTAQRDRARDALEQLRVLWGQCLTGDALDDDLEAEVRPLRPAGPYSSATQLSRAVSIAIAADSAGRDAYVGVHLRRRGSARGGNDAVAVLTAAIADVDCAKHYVDPELALATAMKVPWGPPTLALWSGGGWHLYWCYRERVEATPAAVQEHRASCAWIRAWFNESLDAPCADDMSTPDRILRVAGTHNHKPERQAPDGSVPPIRLVVCEPERLYNIGDVLEFAPVGWSPAPEPGPDVSLPRDVQPQLREVIKALGLRCRPRRDAAGGIRALPLSVCPACGGKDSCYLTPIAGRLVSWRQEHCPAGPGQSGVRAGRGDMGNGLPLVDWLVRYVDPRTLGIAERGVVERVLARHGPGAPELPACRVVRFGDPAAIQVVEHIIRSAMSAADCRRVVVAALTTGSGKTWICLREALQFIAAGGTVVFAVRDHAKADEALRIVERHLADGSPAPPAGVRVLRGALYHCHYHANASDPVRRARIQAAYASGGRALLCTGCPRRKECPGAAAPEVPQGALTIATHAALTTLKMPAAERVLVVADEAVDTVQVEALPLDALTEPLTLARCHEWRREHPDAAATLKQVYEILRQLAFAAGAEARRSKRVAIVTSPTVWMRLRADRALEALLPCWGAAAPDGGQVLSRLVGPPAPHPDEAREPTGRAPDPAAWAFIAGPHTAPNPAAARIGGLMAGLIEGTEYPIYLRVTATGATEVLLPRMAPLPPEVGIVLLDATAHFVSTELEALAVASGRRFDPRRDLWRVAIAGTPPAAALWLDAGSYARPKSVSSGSEEPRGQESLDGRVPARLRRAYQAVLAVGLQHRRVGQRIGLLTWKPLADALRNADGLDDDPVARDARQVIVEAGTRGGQTAFIGHHGRDGIATNAYLDADCDTLIHYGDPRPDWGVVAQVEAVVINTARTAAGLKPVDPRDICQGRQDAAALQGIGRSRYSRAEPTKRWILLYAGTRPPRLLEAAWHRVDVASARVPGFEHHDARMALAERIARSGLLSEAAAARFLEEVLPVPPSRPALRKLLRELRARRGGLASNRGIEDGSFDESLVKSSS